MKWTFDVFDTVVTRAVPEPVMVFDLLEQEWLAKGKGWARGFAEARKRAEREDRQSLEAGRDTTLERIYRRLAGDLGMSSAEAVEAADAEMALELELMRPLSAGIEKLERARREGGFVGFVSDMYLPSDLVRRILAKVGQWRDGDRLWISSEAEGTKSSGRLFDQVEREAGLERNHWCHVGDNRRSDLRVPQERGIRVDPVSAVIGEDRETVLGAAGERQGLLARGAVTRARREVPDDLGNRQRRLWELGASVAGPMLHWLVDEVLRRAEADGRSDLWFLARDGQVMWRIARRIAETREVRPRLHYVAASRQAWHLPALRGLDDNARRWILGNRDSLTAEDVLERLHLGGDEGGFLREAFSRAGISLEGGISGEVDLVWEVLREPEIAARVLERAAAARGVACRYFRPFLGEGRLGLVDIGWGGNMQASLASILADEDGVESLRGWYLGSWSRHPALGEGDFEGLMFDFEDPQLNEWKQLVSLLELFCSGTHAGVTGYQGTGDGACEVLAAPSSWQAQLDWGIGTLQDAAVAAAGRLAEEGVRLDRGRIRSLVLDFGRSPRREEVEALADWPCQSEQNRATSEPFVERYGAGDLADALRGRRLSRLHWRGGCLRYNGFWRYGLYSLARRIGIRLRPAG